MLLRFNAVGLQRNVIFFLKLGLFFILFDLFLFALCNRNILHSPYRHETSWSVSDITLLLNKNQEIIADPEY